jgi:hypothetical protein
MLLARADEMIEGGGARYDRKKRWPTIAFIEPRIRNRCDRKRRDFITLLSGTAASPLALGRTASWIGAPQGPYPVGNPSAQPNQRFAFPSPAAGARDQTFRLIVRPTLWGPQARLRFSNAFGTRPITFDDVHVGLHLGAAALVPGTSRAIRFGGQPRVTVEAGGTAWSDAIDLPFAGNPADPLLQGRKLAISFHVAGESGPMTWHAKALQTSYVTAPDAGAKGGDEGEAAFVYSTSSWFFLDAVDMLAPAATPVVVAFGD